MVSGMDHTLQRGRAFEGAEMWRPIMEHMPAHSLQRGRAFEGAEMMMMSLRGLLSAPLQRGRAFEGAEIVSVSPCRSYYSLASTGPRF